MTKILPKDLTSYDFLKSVAIILMIVDHVGYYFFPDELWFRVVGRMCVPIWFFLIGYARSRDIGAKLWGGVAVLVLANVALGQFLMPVNILATILVIRMVLDGFMRRALVRRNTFWAMNVILFFLIIPSSFIVEYGTLGLVLAIFGFVLRQHEGEITATSLPVQYGLFAFVSFVTMQSLNFGMSGTYMQAFLMGAAIVFLVLFMFAPRTFPRLTKYTPWPLAALIRLTGRRTLEIYVLHLLAFMAVRASLNPDQWTWFGVKLIYGVG